jgi:hypothetical protein
MTTTDSSTTGAGAGHDETVCTHPGAYVDALLTDHGSGQALRWRATPHLADADPGRAALLSTRTGDLALGRCARCGVQVVAAGMTGAPTEHRFEQTPGGMGIDYGLPRWSTGWTALARPGAPDPGEPAVFDLDASAERLLDHLATHQIVLGDTPDDAAARARAAVLAALADPDTDTIGGGQGCGVVTDDGPTPRN